MFNPGFLDRLAGVMREYSAEMDVHPADKLICIINESQIKGNADDLRTFVTDLCDTFANVPQANKQDEDTILYSSSLKDGNYELKPSYDNDVRGQITCKCVHCNEDGLGHIMNAAVKSDSILVTAECAFCEKITEVYFLGLQGRKKDDDREADPNSPEFLTANELQL